MTISWRQIKTKEQWHQTTFPKSCLGKTLAHAHRNSIAYLCIILDFLTLLEYYAHLLNAWQTTGMFLMGVILFTWVEYNVHRYVFHMPTYTKWRAKIQYIVHGVHHEFPKDKDRLAMPPLVSVTIATVLLLLFRLMLGDLVFSFFPGFIVGYAGYLSVHYMVHAYPPPKNFFKKLWINHGIHHYKNGDIIYGVSSPIWDYIYGTMKREKTFR